MRPQAFAAFLAIFPDPAYPALDCDIAYGPPDAMRLSEHAARTVMLETAAKYAPNRQR